MEYCFAEVNLANYAHNLGEIKRYLPQGTKIMAVIKANAYGCGIVEIAKTAIECGIYALGVARIDEALIVRNALPNARILILGYTAKEFLEKAIAQNIELCVYHKDIAEAISREAVAQGKIARIHIKIDTGMGRIGYLCGGNSFWGNHLRCFGDKISLDEPQVLSRSFRAKTTQSTTAIPSVVDSTQSVESSKKNSASAHQISPDSWCKKTESKGAVVPPADFLLESEKRGSPPKSEKRQLLARRGSVVGGAALLRKEKGESNKLKNDDLVESNTDSALDEIESIANLPSVQIAGVFTHFSSADEDDLSYTKMQCDRYSAFVEALESRGIRGFIRHCSNSAGIFSYPKGVFDMVRVGIISYGISPFASATLPIALKPVLSLKARVVHIKTLPKGSAISYGRTFTTSASAQIATVCVGYADGYSRLLSNKAEVLIRGKRAKVVGSVCMDQICVDISGIDGVQIGDEAVLFGVDEWGNEISPDELAHKIGTISYEIICAVSNRVPRVYRD